MVINIVKSYKYGKETISVDYSLYFINLLCDKMGIKSISELDSIFSQRSEIKTMFNILECAIESYNYLNEIEGIDSSRLAAKVLSQNPAVLKEIPKDISNAFKVFDTDTDSAEKKGKKK